MRIAQVAPLSESVPPKHYGGTERIVSCLTEELVRQGQYMTLFASGDSAGAAFLLLQACLGLSVLGLDRRLVFSRTVLPEFLEQVTIRNLRIGEARVDLSLSRDKQDVRIDVLRKQGDLKIVMLNGNPSVASSP